MIYSLASTIVSVQPTLDLVLKHILQKGVTPIPTDIPVHFVKKFSHGNLSPIYIFTFPLHVLPSLLILIYVSVDIPELGVVMTPTPIESIRASKFDPRGW